MKPTEEQSNKIQVLRGLAIIAVVFIHTTPAGILQIWVRPMLNFCVGMFLFLSGLLSNREKWNPIKRIIKLVIPYVIWTLVYTILNNLRNLSSIPLEYGKNLLTGRSAPMMYYVFVYCEFTLLIPIIDLFARSKKKYLPFAISPIEIIILRLVPIVMGIEFNESIQIIISNSCLAWFAFFYLGYLLGNGLINVHISKIKLVVATMGGMVLQVLEAYWYQSMAIENCGTQLKLSALLTGIPFVLIAYKYIISKRTFHRSRIIEFFYIMGNHSFGVFFSHIVIIVVLRRIPGYSHYAVYPICAIVSALMSLLLVIVGKKTMGRYSRYVAF